MASNKPSQNPSIPRFSHEEIARRARELWESRGQPSGQDDAIWLEAERELSRNDGTPASGPGGSSSGRSAAEPKATGRLQRRSSDELRTSKEGDPAASRGGMREPDDESDV